MMPGIELVGTAYKTNSSTSALDCAFDCIREPSCQHFVFMKSSGNCLLMERMGSTNVNADAVSGDMRCFYPSKYTTTSTAATTDVYGNPCFIRDVNFRGFDMAVKKTVDAYQCAYECSFLENCKVFTYTESDSTCNLKSSDQGGAVEQDHVSGSLECFFPDRTTTSTRSGHSTHAPTDPCYLRNTEYFGSTIAVVKVGDGVACHDACRNHQHCLYFSFDASLSLCFLKDSDDGMRSSSSILSGDMSCFHPMEYTTTVPPTPSTAVPMSTITITDPCYKLSTSYQGHLTAVVYAREAADCGSMCHLWPTCRHFTWNRLSKKCYMRETATTLMRNAEAISGSMDCFHPNEYTTTTTTTTTQRPGEATKCFYENVNYLGNDIQVLSAISTLDCSLKCRSQEECRFFTYIRAKKQCYLKNSDANRFNASGFVSGDRYCLFPADYTTTSTRAPGLCPDCTAPGKPCVGPDCERTNVCFVKGLRYTGTIAMQVRTATPNECADFCLTNKICEAVTFNDGSCQLFVDPKEKDAPDYFMSAHWKCLTA